MTLPKNIKKSLKHGRVGEHCLLCNTICNASAVLGIHINFNRFMRHVQELSNKTRVI